MTSLSMWSQLSRNAIEDACSLIHRIGIFNVLLTLDKEQSHMSAAKKQTSTSSRSQWTTLSILEGPWILARSDW